MIHHIMLPKGARWTAERCPGGKQWVVLDDAALRELYANIGAVIGVAERPGVSRLGWGNGLR